MFVGRTGVERVIQRTCEIMKENGITIRRRSTAYADTAASIS